MTELYTSKGTTFTELEADRLQRMPFPDKVSTACIGDIITGQVVADFGCGPSSALAQWVINKGGKYVGLDIDSQILGAHALHAQNAGSKTSLVQADIKTAPLGSETADITHVRFVLEWLGEDDKKAIAEVLRVGKKRCIFLEYDYTNVGGNQEVNEFFQLVVGLMEEHAGVDLYYGHKLAERVTEVVDELQFSVELRQKTISRRNSGDIDELRLMLGKSIQMAEKFGERVTRNRLDVLQLIINRQIDASTNEQIFSYTPPDIYIVEVIKNHEQSI